jgi:hypothetical protein
VGSETADWDAEVALPELVQLDDGTFIKTGGCGPRPAFQGWGVGPFVSIHPGARAPPSEANRSNRPLPEVLRKTG